MAISDYLNNLITQRDNLADNLVVKGVTASKTELLDTLVPKVLQIEGGGTGEAKLNIFTQMNEPEIKEGIWIQTDDVFTGVKYDILPYISPYSYINTKIKVPNLSDGVQFSEAGMYIYISIGFSSYWAADFLYNTCTNTITPIGKFPVDFYNRCIASNDTDIYSFVRTTGTGGTNAARKYNIKSRNYTVLSEPPRYTISGAFTYGSSYIYIIHGHNTTGNPSTYIHRYKISNDTHTLVTTISFSMATDNLVRLGSYCYLLYGTDFYRYTIGTTTMTKLKASVPKGKLFLVDEEIYLIFPSGNTQSLYKYSVVSNVFTLITTISSPQALGSVITSQKTGLMYSISVGNFIYALSLQAKNYDENTLIINNGGEGEYQTNINEDIPLFFNDAWLYKDGLMQEHPSYYGNGNSWIKFKN